jgi:hypothetical protein
VHFLHPTLPNEPKLVTPLDLTCWWIFGKRVLRGKIACDYNDPAPLCNEEVDSSILSGSTTAQMQIHRPDSQRLKPTSVAAARRYISA